MFPAEAEHDLLILFKGFDFAQARTEYQQLLAPFQHISMDMPDEGVDITAYMAAVKTYVSNYRYFCFLNSYSLIQDTGWLRKLYTHISDTAVGLVGASGSWVSHRTNVLAHLQNPAAYLRSKKNNIAADNVVSAKKGARIASLLEFVLHMPTYLTAFDPWPNYFIRTNGFMVSGELLLTLGLPKVKTKLDAYRFESGKEGLTRKILGLGKAVKVVGKDGKAYDKEAWDRSNTLFQSEQENLLIADNRTNEYQFGTAERRLYLSAKAWRHS